MAPHSNLATKKPSLTELLEPAQVAHSQKEAANPMTGPSQEDPAMGNATGGKDPGPLTSESRRERDSLCVFGGRQGRHPK